MICLSRAKVSSKSPDFRPRLLLSELSLFFTVQIIGLYVAIRIAAVEIIPVVETGPAVKSFLILFTIATAVFLLLIRFLKKRLGFMKILMAFIIFVGSETVFIVFFSEFTAMLLAISLVIIRFTYPTIFVQNASLILALAGVGASIGLLFNVSTIFIILAVLSVYDIIAVYKTKHMLTLFKGTIKGGVPLALIASEKISGMRSNLKKANINKPATKREYTFLGTGDVAFPLILAVSALRTGLFASLAVVVGGLVGILIIHSLLIYGKGKPIPALPPLAACTMGAYLVASYLLI
ncbi:MAG: hypothetical protein CL963_02855 [Euryarchaeota archaeon]|nr:hypothetical protein [Euryarchaeota archaeon]